MSRAEDLSGRTFGYLTVLERSDDHITKSGQKKVMWICKCTLCGNTKSISAQDLKTGNTISCGCYQSRKGFQSRSTKICVICGKAFQSPPSDKKVTCSQECRKNYAAKRMSGKKRSAETKKRISASSKGRDMTEIQKLGTDSAKLSPKSGRFETNINAIDWHLVSPDGKHYHFHSLNFWLRENCRELFGCDPDGRAFNNIKSGLAGAKRAMLGKKYNCTTYKGWQVLPTEDDI